MSISPLSFLIRAGFPACIRSRIATALFSHRFRSHSSIARCASDPVCGGTIRAAGVPSAERNALSGNVAAGTAAMAMTARWMSGLSSGRIPQANCQAPVRSCLDGLSSVGQLHQYAVATAYWHV